MPLLPFFEIFHSSLRSKLSYSSFDRRLPPSCIFPFVLRLVSTVKTPSDTFQALPGAPPPYLCQPALVFPSKREIHSSIFSAVFWLFCVLPEPHELITTARPAITARVFICQVLF